MIYDENLIERFHNDYRVDNISLDCNDVYTTASIRGESQKFLSSCDCTVNITMTQFGFQQMLQKLYGKVDDVSISDLSQYLKLFTLDKASPNEVLVVQVDTEKFTLDTVNSICEEIAERFPEQEELAIPIGTSIEYMSEDSLVQIRDKLNMLIDAHRFEKAMGFDNAST